MWVVSSDSLRGTVPDSGCTGPLSDTVDRRQTWSLAFPFSRFVDILKCCTDTSQIEIFRIGQRIAKLSMECISALSSIQISSPLTSPRIYKTVSPVQPNQFMQAFDKLSPLFYGQTKQHLVPLRDIILKCLPCSSQTGLYRRSTIRLLAVPLPNRVASYALAALNQPLTHAGMCSDQGIDREPHRFRAPMSCAS